MAKIQLQPDTETVFYIVVNRLLAANLVAYDATNLAEVRSRIFRLDVLPALGSEHDVPADLPHFVGCLVFQLQTPQAVQTFRLRTSDPIQLAVLSSELN